MSTRATLTISDGPNHRGNSFSIYRHGDGYPDTEHGVLATLNQALQFAWPLPRYEAMDFAAAIIRAWKDSGGGIYFTNGRDYHGDTVYHYEIYPDGKGKLVVDTFVSTYPNGYDSDAVWIKHGRKTILGLCEQPA